MKNYSLATKVSISFGLCLILLLISLFIFKTYQDERELDTFKERQFQSINYLATLYQNSALPNDIDVYFKNFGLSIVDNLDLSKSILENGKVIFQRLSTLGMVFIYKYNNQYYLFLNNNLDVKVLLKSSITTSQNNSIPLSFAVILILLTWVYISTLLSLSPLKSLRQTVRKFASGNMNVECKINRNDEIGELSSEFNKAIKTIRDLLGSRQLFLRMIMHELKTPIGKGRIIAEMINDDLQKVRLRNIFERLEILINEFSKIEQLISKNYSLKKQSYEIRTIFEHSFDMLLLDSEQLDNKLTLKLGRKLLHVEVDLDLMALAFKNLIDNAIKYSENRKVVVKLEDKILSFNNLGNPLKRPISELMQAFITTTKKSYKAEYGLGLGLYIVESILKMHNLALQYKYDKEERNHCFYIDLKTL